MAQIILEKIKSGSNGNGGKNQRFYKIEGEVKDPGQLYVLDTAIKSHLNKRYSERFKIIESSPKHGKNYSSMIAIEGYLDIKELEFSVNNSGRQASKVNLKTEIKVTSIDSNEYSSEEIKRKHEDELTGKEREIEHLKMLVQENNESLEKSNNKIKLLELEIKSRPKAKFDNLLEAILEGYIGNKDVLIYEVAEDYCRLNENKDIVVFLNQRTYENRISYIDYLNVKYNLDVSGEKVLDELLSQKESEKSWNATKKGRELEELVRLNKNDLSLLELSKVAGLTEEMIAAIKSITEKNKLREIEQNIEKYKAEFENEKKAYEEIKNSREKYDEFSRIYDNAMKRKSEGCRLPILIFSEKGHVKIYSPLFAKDEELQKHILSILSFSFKEDLKNVSIVPRAYSENVAEFTLLGSALKIADKIESAKKVSGLLKGNEVFNALGVTIEPFIKIN